MIPADSLRAALDSVFRAPAYDWVPPLEPVVSARRWWDRLVEWLAALQRASPLIFRGILVLLVLVLAAVILHAAWVTWKVMRGAAPAPGESTAAPPPKRDAGWYLAEADRLAVAGRRAEAMQFAFIAVALRLDALDTLRFHWSKTPGELAREARLAPADGARLRALVGTLYRCTFAGEPCDPEDWHGWRAAALEEWHATAQ